mmetsp:Transcript_7519/g.15302  ORF Transcript_7519/g.15302 Transcript_7519/m.15302 type:complete len:324 (-) Transcript_7519:158-1129(-)
MGDSGAALKVGPLLQGLHPRDTTNGCPLANSLVPEGGLDRFHGYIYTTIIILLSTGCHFSAHRHARPRGSCTLLHSRRRRSPRCGPKQVVPSTSISASQHARVEGLAGGALVVDKVELGGAPAAAVVAQNLLREVAVLLRELLRHHQRLQHVEIYRHVCEGLGAHRAGVRSLGVGRVAVAVHEVPTRGLAHRAAAREERLLADGAVGVKGALAADVRLGDGKAHALVAPHAVEHIHAQPLAAPAQVAEGAVVHGVRGVVVIQVAHPAVVPRHGRLARHALLARRLLNAALHAHHGGRGGHGVHGHLLVMAPAARHQLAAAGSH